MTEPQHRFPCVSCGADYRYDPGKNHLICDHCGDVHAIVAGGPWQGGIKELDFERALRREVLVPGVPWMLSGAAFVGEHQRMLDVLGATDASPTGGRGTTAEQSSSTAHVRLGRCHSRSRQPMHALARYGAASASASTDGELNA